MANRIWQHLFGRGLVSSVDNFGLTGDVPSHPELLDHLATRFVQKGWSIKKLVRAIVLSRAYQLSSNGPAAMLAVDPANRLIWRHSPRRLDAEEIRDAMLAAAGNLNSSRFIGSPAQDFKVSERRSASAPAEKTIRWGERSYSSKFRSIYLPLLRALTPQSLEVFDFAEQGMVTGRRDTTTVSTQALYLLNGPFVKQQSLALADRVLAHSDLTDADRIRLAYQLTFARPATNNEIVRVEGYLAEYKSRAGANKSTASSEKLASAAMGSFCQAIFASAEFRYVR